VDQELKAIALSNLAAKLRIHIGKEHPQELYWGWLDEFGSVRQALTVHEILEEIKNETPTGERYLLAAAVDPDKTEEENKKILQKFIGRIR